MKRPFCSLFFKCFAVMALFPFVICVYIPACYVTEVSAAEKKMEAIKEDNPRYEKGEDGIWHLKKKVKKTKGVFDTDIDIKEWISSARSIETKAVCMFTGDLMCLKGQQYDAARSGTYKFFPAFKYVEPIFGEADLVCGNLETLLSQSNPLTKNQVEENGQPQCNGPVAYLDGLKKAGLDVLVTANNHTCDWGAKGIKETKTHLDDYGFANVGTHYNEKTAEKAGERFAIFDVKGINIAVLSYTHIINQRGKMSASEMKTMVHLFDRDVVKKDISDAKAAGAEFVAVYLHLGTENTEELTRTQIDDMNFTAEAGADLILGSHPHCLQKCTYIKTSDKRKVLCMYSMGNFVSSMARDINNDTIILRVEITKTRGKKNVKVSMSDAPYIPCRVTAKDNYSFVVVPTSSDMNGGYSSKTLKEAEKRIGKVMGGVIKKFNPEGLVDEKAVY